MGLNHKELRMAHYWHVNAHKLEGLSGVEALSAPFQPFRKPARKSWENAVPLPPIKQQQRPSRRLLLRLQVPDIVP